MAFSKLDRMLLMSATTDVQLSMEKSLELDKMIIDEYKKEMNEEIERNNGNVQLSMEKSLELDKMIVVHTQCASPKYMYKLICELLEALEV